MRAHRSGRRRKNGSKFTAVAIVAVVAVSGGCGYDWPSGPGNGGLGSIAGQGGGDSGPALDRSDSGDARRDGAGTIDGRSTGAADSAIGGRDGASGAGGTGGAGGSGGGGGGGPMVDPVKCRQCQETKCYAEFDEGYYGVCYDAKTPAELWGPGPAAGVEKIRTCQDLLACIRTNGCATVDNGVYSYFDCWCGKGTPASQCTTMKGAAKGPCREKVELASNSQDPAEITERFTNPTVPAAAARYVHECEDRLDLCKNECVLGQYGTGGAGGSGAGGSGGMMDAAATGGSGSSGGAAGGGGGGGGGGSSGGGGMTGGSGGNAGTGGMTAGAGGATGGSGGRSPTPSAACNACVAANCADEGPGCDSLATPARKQLCETLSRCMRQTDCGKTTNTECWCGPQEQYPIPMCTTEVGFAKGPCLAEELAAAESMDPKTISNRFIDGAYASGAAHNRASCEKEFCMNECILDPGGGSGGAGGSAGGSAGAGGAGGGTAGGAGGSAGTGGSAGAGGTGGAAGSAGGAGGTTGGGPDPSPACDACVAASCQEDGPGCTSIANPQKRQLCEALSRCMRRTQCATASSSVCWCGATPIATCSTTAGSAAGPCLAEELAAAESTDPATITERFMNPTFASGVAHLRSACEKESCLTECAGTGGTGGSTGGAGGATGGTGGAGGATGGAGGVTGGAGGATGGAGGATGGAGGATGGTGGATGGTGGTGGGPAPSCPDLDQNGRLDCQESLLANPDFDTGAEPWQAEAAAVRAWERPPDGKGEAASGSLLVTNQSPSTITTQGGAYQCIPALGGKSYLLISQLFIPPGQGQGSGGVNIQFFPSTNCTPSGGSPNIGVFMSQLIVAADSWRLVDNVFSTPTAAKSMLVRLVVTKSGPPLYRVRFDNVLLKPL
jgi:hypothetical protein